MLSMLMKMMNYFPITGLLILAAFFSKNDALTAQERVISMGVGPIVSKFVPNVNYTVFIDTTPINRSGILFGVSAYFVSNAPVRFQVWRLKSGREYTLKFDYLYNYFGQTFARQDIVFDRCYPVNQGDLLGIFIEKTPWPIPYNYYDEINKGTLQTFMNPIPVVDQGYFIDTLHFPYRFSLSSWIVYDEVRNVSEFKNECPANVFIPKDTSTTPGTTTPRPPPTGAMGDTGDTGQMGPAGRIGQWGLIGSTGSTGYTGNIGLPGRAGPIGSTGYPGEKGSIGRPGDVGYAGMEGLVGATGYTGPIGRMGPPGPDATNPRSMSLTDGTQAGESMATAKQWWRQESLVTGVYVWLAILSFLMIACFVWAAVLCCKFKQLKKRGLASSKGSLIKE